MSVTAALLAMLLIGVWAGWHLALWAARDEKFAYHEREHEPVDLTQDAACLVRVEPRPIFYDFEAM